MPNPGAFQGSRKEFLTTKKAEFTRSVTFGYTAELLMTIQRQYFKRYPIDLPHNEEPSAEHLAAVDDDAADPEIEEPDEKTMSAEDYKAAMERMAERLVLIKKRKAQIKRWFIYQYMKDHDGDPRDERASSPYQVFLAKMRGSDPDKPRRKSAVNVWRKFHRDRIDKLAKLTAARENIGKSGMASLRDRIARDLFYELPVDEQKEWSDTANEEHKLAIEEWNNMRNRPVSTDPADRQRAIQNLVRFVQPVLDVIANSTGWKVSLFAGGPEPAQEGMLNVISVHSGTTTGDMKLSFGQSERAAIKKDFIPAFGGFLQKCYSPEECRARALSGSEGFVPISDMELEGGDALIHPLEPVIPNSQSPAVVSVPTANTPAPASIVQPAPVAVHTVQSAPVLPVIPAQSAPVAPASFAQPSTAENDTEEDDSMPDLQDPMEDDDDDDEEDEEDTPMPTVYRLPSDPPASPGFSPTSLPASHHASVAPSPPASPTFGAPSLPVLPKSVEPAVPALSLTSPSVPPATSIAISAVPLLTAPAACATPPVPAPSVGPGSAASTAPSSTPSSALNPSSAPPVFSVSPVSSAPVIPSSTPSSIPPGLPTVTSKANRKRKREKENATPVVCETSRMTEESRPRREVKKTAKALRIEEELAEKSQKAKQHPRKDVGQPSSSVVVESKGSRVASKKRGPRA